MELDEFKKICNEHVRLNKINFTSVQAQDLYEIYQKGLKSGLTIDLTLGGLELMARCYFRGYETGQNSP